MTFCLIDTRVNHSSRRLKGFDRDFVREDEYFAGRLSDKLFLWRAAFRGAATSMQGTILELFCHVFTHNMLNDGR
jgi:hypothetical protein